MAYQKGLAGAFWFIVPNVACFYVLIPIARHMKRRYQGYTIADYFSKHLNDSRLVLAVFSLATVAFQMCAIIENNIAIGLMMDTLTDFARPATVAILFGITVLGVILIVLHGFRGSVVTDILQMSVTLTLCVVVAGLVAFSAKDEATITDGLGGRTSDMLNPFTLSVVLSPGIAMALGLIGGPMADMMFFQRIMALRDPAEVTKALAVAGLLFAIVPISLSVPGFIAASAADPTFHAANPEAIGLIATAHFAPKIGIFFFCIIIVTGLMTTLEAAFSSITAIAGTDFFRLFRRLRNNEPDQVSIHFSWIVLVGLAILGFFISISGVNLLPVFLTDAAIATSMIVPVVYGAIAKRFTTLEVVVPLVLSFSFALVIGATGAIWDLESLSSSAAPGAFVIGILALGVTRIAGRRFTWGQKPPLVERL